MGTITLLNSIEYKRQPIPEVGKEYHIFDDGKIKPNRHSIITIAEVIPFDEFKDMDPDMIEIWYEEVKECYWLYAPDTDYFVKGTFEGEDDDDMWFVRTTDGGWFSFGWWGARLDIDGSLYKDMIKWVGKENL
jgi:hypothetical protein